MPTKKTKAKQSTKKELEVDKLAEHERLTATITFTPRTYKVSMCGDGGQRVLRTVSREIYNYFKDNNLSLSAFASDSHYAGVVKEIPEDMWPFSPNSWFGRDSLVSASGVDIDSGTITVFDDNNDIVYENELDDAVDDDGVELLQEQQTYIRFQEDGVIFSGVSRDVGTFFEGNIELKMPFDRAKLSLYGENVDGTILVYNISYDGEYVDNFGACTEGKSSDFNFYVVKDGEIIEDYSEPAT